ncbi:MAG: hypothetical protein AAGF66_20590, partial [Cyanobacteria bacterium P01_H01_bin.119]
MGRAAKYLAWAGAGILLTIAAEKPGFSQEIQPVIELPEFSEEPRDLNPPQLTLIGPELTEPERMTPGGLATKAQETAQANPGQTEADRLFQQGTQQFQASQFQAAIAFWQQALEIYREI